MISADDFTYALENTRVIVEPKSTIETFGQTRFQFQLVTEPMDAVGIVRVRAGLIHAERPRILAPQHMNQFLLEGFGKHAEEMIELFRNYPEHLKILRYGFIFKKTDISEKVEMIMRQTDYDAETAERKLLEFNDDALKVIKHYLGILDKPVQKTQLKSVNQEIYRQLRNKLNVSEFNKKQQEKLEAEIAKNNQDE